MHTHTWFLGISLCSLAVAVGCGDDQNLADPRLIAGGGVGDGAIAGRVNLYVIDADTDDPVGSAEISIGESGEEPIEGMTDSSGLLQVDDDSLDGPTTITIVASGYVTATWFGANGANVTIPLDPEDDPTDIPRATLSGTIDSWNDLPAPATDHFYIAVAGYSQTDDLGDPANELPQPGGPGGLPANACINSEFLTECDWELVTRTGTIAVFAAIVDIDTKGTLTDDSDDTNVVIGFAYKLDIDVSDGVDQSGITLDQLEIGAMTEVDVVVAQAPSGLDDVGIILGLDLGDNGIAMVGFSDDPDQTSFPIPDLTGDFASASYRAYALAGDLNDEDDADPMSATLLRGITDLSADIDFGDWMSLPISLSASGGEYSFTPVDDAELHTASFLDANADSVWGVALLDGRTEFTLPGLDPDPLPSTGFDLIVSAIDGEVDLEDFSIDDFTDTLDRMARNRNSFTN